MIDGGKMSDNKKKQGASKPLSLYPLKLEDALRATMETGPPPDKPKARERVKRKKAKPKADASEEPEN